MSNTNLSIILERGQAAMHLQTLSCCICYDSKPLGLSCGDEETPHFICSDCLGSYAFFEVQAGGKYDREVTVNHDGKEVVSAPGCLPCPLFGVHDGCSCAALDESQLIAILGIYSAENPDALNSYLTARGRLAIEVEHRAEEARLRAEEEHQDAGGDVAFIRSLIELGLDRGQFVPCPACGEGRGKDDACMHMTCPCGTKFCYACGRERPRYQCESGCDSLNCFFEGNPGWENLPREAGVSNAHAALVAFHIDQCSFMVKTLCRMVEPELWRATMEAHPGLLDNVLEGKSVTLQGACLPPLFGAFRQPGRQRDAELERRTAEAVAIFRTRADLAGKRHLLLTSELPIGQGGQRPRTYCLAVKAGPDEPMVRYLLMRDRRGMRKFNPEYLMYRQRGNRRGAEELVMMAKRRGHVTGGASYYINNLEGGNGGDIVRKKAPNYCGKLRVLSSRVHVMLNNMVSKGELGVIIYSSNTYNDDEQMEHGFDEHSLLSRQSVKPSVVLPPIDDGGMAVAIENAAGADSAIANARHAYGNSHFERIQPQLDERLSYALPFVDDRIEVKSRKNICLHRRDHGAGDSVVLQFGKARGEDRYHLDVRAPFTPFQALCFACSIFETF